MIRCRQTLPNFELSVMAMTVPAFSTILRLSMRLGLEMRGDAALQVEAVDAEEQLVHVQGVQRFHRQAAVERHALATQLAAQHHDIDVALRRQRGEHAEIVGDHGHLDVRQRFRELDARGAGIDDDGVAGLDQRRGAYWPMRRFSSRCEVRLAS